MLADGSRVLVHHHDFIAFAGGRVAVVTEADNRVHDVEVMLVTKLDLAPPVSSGSIAPNPNGGE